jgi:predicted Zn finger-like uncharacterized protein
VKISCPSCSAKYSISDEKVVSRLAKIRCRKCSATIVIDGKVNPPTVTATAAGGADAGEDHAVQEQTDTAGPEYSVDLGEGDQRTMPLSDIVAAYNSGQISGETFVWADGFSDWKALSEVQEIVDALHAAAGGGQPAPAAAASPWDTKAPTSQPSPVRAAARPARAAAGDLFGRIDRAGSEEEVATSAPDQGGLLGGSSSSGGGGGTGARNESSVLFSLSALTSASAPSNRSVSSPVRSSSGASTASRDDSGLIDLKALTAAAVKSDGAGPLPLSAPALSPLAASPLGVAAPLGLGSPLGGGLVSGDLGPAQKSKTGLFIAIAIVAAAVIVALAVILKPAPPPPVVAAPPPPPVPTAAPTPTPTPTLAAAPPPTGSADSESETAKKPTSTSTYRRPTGVAKKPTGGTTTTSGSEPAAAPKPKSKCGCASGDLQCAMRCAAKGG